ncbi:DUF2065 domain-containing protein [Planctobacterium marinum]|uniref:DUF2065 domain-containing protein n=1 Tax=Planctobacterium marinum TaxID=1631968 RepID=UPI001E3282D2|nr:DUF2065 domain-containing protein [Planctobacterium marinum]MCC2606612.1 DUF2065 domain-containing protein [Planctobacterium marinum]
MDSLWLALALLLILEGVGPLLFPNRWQKYLHSLSQLPAAQLQKVGAAMVLGGAILLWLLLV